MHGTLVPAKDVDDFVILRMRAFTSKSRHLVVQSVLTDEDLPLLEWQLIFSVARFGTCHLAHITRHTSIDPAHGSRAASALEKKGLISRTDDVNNRRRKLISLTPKGVDTFERIWPRAQSLIGVVEDSLNRSEFNELKRLLDKSNQALEKMMEDMEKRENNDAYAHRKVQQKVP